MKYIKKIESVDCEHGTHFDIIYLANGKVLAITENSIGIFQSAEEFESGKGNPFVIDFIKSNDEKKKDKKSFN
jgi:hypothetical protein